MTDAPLIQTAGTRHGVMILIASVMPVMAIIALVPVLPLLLREFADVSGSEFLVPIAMTVPALCVAVFSPVAGWLSDRLGRKNLLVGSMVLYAVFGIIPWFLDDLFQIIGARIALGAVEAMIMTVATTLIGDYFEGEKRERWIALQVAAASLSAIVLIAMGGILGEMLGSRGPFLMYLLALPAAAATAGILFEPAAAKAGGTRAEARFPLGAIAPLVLTTLFVGVIFYTIIVQLGPILEIPAPVSPGVIGMIGAACNCAVGIGSLVFHKGKQHVGFRLLAVGLVFAAVGYAGASLGTTLPVIAAFVILASIGSGMMLPNMLTWTMSRLPPQMRGRGMGLWTGAFFLGQFLAPLLAAAVTGMTGAMAATLLAYATTIAVAAVIALLLSRLSAKTADAEA
jgi:MFS family permease